MQSEDDELFNQIIDRITSAISVPIGIEHTLDENYDTIVNAIGDKNKTFCFELGKDQENWKCEWFSGKKCDCTEYGGTNICDVVKAYIKLVLDMQNDELIQKIESAIYAIDDLPLCTIIDHAIKKYEDEIEDKLQEARKKIDENE